MAAGNGLRAHLLQAMVQSRSNPSGRRGFNNTVLGSLGRGVPKQAQLQQLLQRLQGGDGSAVQHLPVQMIHGFGPGGAATGGGDSDPRAQALGGQRPGYNESGTQNRPADVMHAGGADEGGAAEMYMQHHPGAREGKDAIPDWVMSGLTQALQSSIPGGLHPGHIQQILEHLSSVIGQGVTPAPAGTPATAPTPPGGPIYN